MRPAPSSLPRRGAFSDTACSGLAWDHPPGCHTAQWISGLDPQALLKDVVFLTLLPGRAARLFGLKYILGFARTWLQLGWLS